MQDILSCEIVTLQSYPLKYRSFTLLCSVTTYCCLLCNIVWGEGGSPSHSIYYLIIVGAGIRTSVGIAGNITRVLSYCMCLQCLTPYGHSAQFLLIFGNFLMISVFDWSIKIHPSLTKVNKNVATIRRTHFYIVANVNVVHK